MEFECERAASGYQAKAVVEAAKETAAKRNGQLKVPHPATAASQRLQNPYRC